MEIQSDQPSLILEPLEERHAAELFQLLRDPGLYTFIPEDPPASVEKLAERYRFLSGRKSPDNTEHWLNWVLKRDTGVPLGTLQATVDSTGEALIAYLIFPEHWGKGFGRFGVQMMMATLIGNYGVKVFRALVDTRNQASIRLLESLGFVRVGIRKEADFFHGQSSDEYEYCLEQS